MMTMMMTTMKTIMTIMTMMTTMMAMFLFQSSESDLWRQFSRRCFPQYSHYNPACKIIPTYFHAHHAHYFCEYFNFGWRETDDVTVPSFPRRELPNYWPGIHLEGGYIPVPIFAPLLTFQCNCLQETLTLLTKFIHLVILAKCNAKQDAAEKQTYLWIVLGWELGSWTFSSSKTK